MKRVSGEQIVEHFDSIPRGAGTPVERVEATVRYFKIKPAPVCRYLKFWWPRKRNTWGS